MEFLPKSPYNDAWSLPSKIRFIFAITPIVINSYPQKTSSLSGQRARLFNDKMNFHRGSFPKEACRITLSFASTLRVFVDGESVRYINRQNSDCRNLPAGIFGARPGTICHCVEPSYWRTWEFKRQVLIAAYSCLSTGLICLSSSALVNCIPVPSPL